MALALNSTDEDDDETKHFYDIDEESVHLEQEMMRIEFQNLQMMEVKLSTAVSNAEALESENSVLKLQLQEGKEKYELEINGMEHKNSELEKKLNEMNGSMHALQKLNLEQLLALDEQLHSSRLSIKQCVKNHYEDKYDCRICFANAKDVVLIPCGHFLCHVCVGRVQQCPMCRVRIQRSIPMT